MDYSIAWTGLSGTAASVGFYNGVAGANGSSIQNLTITTPGATSAATGQLTLTAAQETDLLAGKWYYIISTANNANGEVRGQITATVQR